MTKLQRERLRIVVLLAVAGGLAVYWRKTRQVTLVQMVVTVHQPPKPPPLPGTTPASKP